MSIDCARGLSRRKDLVSPTQGRVGWEPPRRSQLLPSYNQMPTRSDQSKRSADTGREGRSDARASRYITHVANTIILYKKY